MDYQLTYHEAENIEAERNLRAFKKLEKSHTDEAYKAYRKAQSTYISVLKKFIKQNVALNDDFSERYDEAVGFCVENQFEVTWAFLEKPENEIKVLHEMIDWYEYEISYPSEFIDEAQG